MHWVDTSTCHSFGKQDTICAIVYSVHDKNTRSGSWSLIRCGGRNLLSCCQAVYGVFSFRTSISSKPPSAEINGYALRTGWSEELAGQRHVLT